MYLRYLLYIDLTRQHVNKGIDINSWYRYLVVIEGIAKWKAPLKDPILWNSYHLWRKDNNAETEAKADMAPSSSKQFQTCSVPTSPI